MRKQKKTKPLIDRLLAKVKIDENGCWIWQGTKNGAGYGTIGLGTAAAGKGFVHRVSHELFIGPIPGGSVVCHKCDNKLCIYPLHLFSGTQQQNLDDAKQKGRMLKGDAWWTAKRIDGDAIVMGERHGMSKLTSKDVLRIRELYSAGSTITALAEFFLISRRQIRNIVNRANWVHI